MFDFGSTMENLQEGAPAGPGPGSGDTFARAGGGAAPGYWADDGVEISVAAPPGGHVRRSYLWSAYIGLHDRSHRRFPLRTSRGAWRD